ncbi:sugar transferase [Sphingorhabdus sp. EL138]|uniref:sugar transferase n=1 Tax=Sphingorhabdus sp. EL138 TaxID=2073156 RepID=UPI0015736DA2|nr:sugar transferase [Sphingorhabdus sp. EL138]
MKRIFDICVSIFLMLLLAPLILIIAILILMVMGKPVLFTQKRPGIKGSPFMMVKFRTMRNAVDKKGDPLPDSKRLTKFGIFLRNTSLDELPGLWNVLNGDMSMVGPRPLLMQYMPLYNQEQLRRHEVKPGITGWAQINGRNAISWEQKFKYDVWYVDNQSFWLDVKILFLTLGKTIARKGINAADDATMPIFTGSKS